MTDARLVEYYRKRAIDYEQIYYRDDPSRRTELEEESYRLEDLARGKSVLDIPCGTGYWLERMATVAREIVAADLSLEMIRQAQTKTLGCPVEFVQADLCKPPFVDRKFDLVALGFWFSHHPCQDYGELFEVLKSLVATKGMIWMIDNNPVAEGSTRRPVGTDDAGNHLTCRQLSDGREFVIIKNYFKREQLEDLFKPEFKIKSLVYGKNYWSVALTSGS